jgi:CRP/FNR family transcriptional regulator, dissimilatory nitrate respiration regulator
MGTEDRRTDTIRRLAAVPLFAGLPEAQLTALAGIGLPRMFAKGHVLFAEGDTGAEGLYVILAGRVKVFRLSVEGKEQIFHIFEASESFGEASLFTGQGFPAHAQALTAVETLFFPRPGFIELIRKDPSLALNMLALLSLRLRKFAAMIDDLSLKEVPGRLAAYLLYLNERQGGPREMELDMTKGQLAALLGTIPETLSRILTKMNGLSLIETRGTRIRIIDPARLREIASEGRKLSPS